MLRVHRIDRITDLERYRLPWRSLWQQTRGANFFQTLDWLQAYWRHFGRQQQLCVLCVSDNEKLIGILPLVVITEATGAGRVAVLTYPLHDWGVSYGPIGPQPTVTLLESMRFLASERPAWDMIDLRWIAPAIDVRRTESAMQATGMTGWTGIWKTTSIIEFNNTWADYLASRSPKFRNNLRRAAKRAVGQMVYERHRPAGAMENETDCRWDLFETCVLVARQSWQATASFGTTMSHPEISEFLRDAHQAAVVRGAVDINLLWFHGKPIAYAYNYVAGGEVIGLRMGYDKAYADLSPGRLLWAHMVEDSFRRGDRLIDLGPGSEEIKRPWRTGTTVVERCSHYPLGSVKGQVLRMKRFLVGEGPLDLRWRRRA